MILCPQLKNEEVRKDFNEILVRLGGVPIEDVDIANREPYRAKLDEPQLNAYYRTNYLWSETFGDIGKIRKKLDNLEGKPSERPPVSLSEEFDSLQSEAARRASQVIDTTTGKLQKQLATSLRKDAEKMWPDLGVSKMIRDLAEGGGLSRKFLNDYDQDTVTYLTRRFPGLIKKDGAWGLDVAASRYGYESEDALLQELLSTPTKKDFIDKYVEDGLKNYEDDIALDDLEVHAKMVEAEIQIMSENEPGLIDMVMATRPEWAGDTAEKRGGVRVSLTRKDTAYDNLKAGIKMAARNSKIAFSAGKKEEALKQKLIQKDLIEKLKNRFAARIQKGKIQRNVARTLKSFAKAKGFNPIYQDALVDLLKPLARVFGLTKKLDGHKNQTDSRMPLADAFRHAEENGESIPDGFIEELYALRGIDLKQMDIDDMSDVLTAVRMLYHYAKMENQVMEAERGMTFREMVSQQIDSIFTSRGFGKPEIILRPSVRVGGKQYDGEPGQVHQDVLAKNNLLREDEVRAKQEERGFVGPDNRFMDREESKAWVEQNQPDVAKLLPSGEMHSQGYAAAARGARLSAKGIPVTALEKLEAKAAKEMGGSMATRLWMDHRRTEFLDRDLDGFRYRGPNFMAIDLPIQKAMNRLLVLRDGIHDRYLKAHEEFEKEIGITTEKWVTQKITLPGRTGFITRGQAFMAFMHMQNEANLKTITAQKGNYFNQEQLDYIQNLMIDAEKKLMQAHIDHYSSFKDLIWKTHYALHGVYPKEVEGVYVPIVLDPDIDVQTEALLSKSASKDLTRDQFDSPVVNSSFTKSRVGTSRAASLEYSQILQRLYAMARYISLAKPIRDIQKIFSDPEWSKAVIGTRGRAWYDQYMPYLQDIANPNRNATGKDGVQRYLDLARRATVIHAIGLYVNTSIKHFFEWVPSAVELGLFRNIGGFGSFIGSFARQAVTGEPNAFQTINKMSVQMAHSAHSIERDIGDFLASMEGESKKKRFIANHIMDLIRLTDIFMRYSTWIAAYNNAMSGKGAWSKALWNQLAMQMPGIDGVQVMTPEIAAEVADTVIRMTKAVPGVENLPALGRRPGFSRLVFTLGQYVNTSLNFTVEQVNRFRHDPTYSFWNLSRALFILLILGPLMRESAVKRKIPHSAGEAGLWVGEGLAEMTPASRWIGGMALSGIEHYRGRPARMHMMDLPGLNFTTNVAQLIYDSALAAGGHQSGFRVIEDLLETIGTAPISGPMAGMPPEQAIIAMRGALDLYTGKSKTWGSLLSRSAKYNDDQQGPSQSRSRLQVK